MQTFLPYPDLYGSLYILDNKRLCKQRLEAFQLLIIIRFPEKVRGYKNHPIVKMWKDHYEALKRYYNHSLIIWQLRGFKNGMKFIEQNYKIKVTYPDVFGHKAFHDSHRSNLLRKNPIYYSSFNWDVPNNLTYIWNI